MLFINETFLVYKLETFKKCKEVKHIMNTIIAILRDISSAVENYFQRILRTPHEKIHSPIFTQSTLNI